MLVAGLLFVLAAGLNSNLPPHAAFQSKEIREGKRRIGAHNETGAGREGVRRR